MSEKIVNVPNNHNRLKWSHFEWFSHKKEIPIDTITIRCRASSKKSEKILFCFDKLKLHVTLELKKRMFDVHLTSDVKGRPHQNLFCIPLHHIKRRIRKNHDSLRKYIGFIPFNDRNLQKFELIDPYSNRFLNRYSDLSECGYISPLKLWRSKVKHCDAMRYNGKHYLLYDKLGRRVGIVKTNIRKHGFDFCSEEPVKSISEAVYNKGYVKEKLLEVGLVYNPKADEMSENWLAAIALIEKLPAIKSAVIKRMKSSFCMLFNRKQDKNLDSL